MKDNKTNNPGFQSLGVIIEETIGVVVMVVVFTFVVIVILVLVLLML